MNIIVSALVLFAAVFVVATTVSVLIMLKARKKSSNGDRDET